jgi:hypothetical protein
MCTARLNPHVVLHLITQLYLIRITNLKVCGFKFLHPSCYFLSLLGPNILFSILQSNTLILLDFFRVRDEISKVCSLKHYQHHWINYNHITLSAGNWKNE